MGANPTQALGFLVFLIAFVLFAVSLMGGGSLAALGGAATLVCSAALFIKAKPWEHLED